MKSTIENPMSMVVTSPRTNKAGRALGNEMRFCAMTAGELRKKLKSEGLTGAELTRRVNSVLCGEMDVRKVVGIAYVQHLCNQGFVPDVAKSNKANTKQTLTFERVEVPKLTETEIDVMDDKERARLLTLLNAKAQQAKADKAAINV